MGIKETAHAFGYAQYVTTTPAFGLNDAPTTGAKFQDQSTGEWANQPNAILMQAEAQNIRWRGDNVDPTATVGNILYVGQTLCYDGELNRIRFIQATSGAILNVQYLYGGSF